MRGAFTWPDGAKAAVSLTFDDTRPSQLDHGIPVLDAHGVKATFYASPDNLIKREADWRRIAGTGHEIGNHSMVHPCSGSFPWARERALEDYSLERMEAELREANRFLARIAGREPTTFAYPCGQTFVGRGENHHSYVPLVSRLFVAGRGFLWETHNHPAYCEMGHLAAYFSDGYTPSRYAERLEEAIRDGGWAIFAGHDVGRDGGYQTTLADALDAFCRHLTERRDVWTATVAEVAEWVRAHRG